MAVMRCVWVPGGAHKAALDARVAPPKPQHAVPSNAAQGPALLPPSPSHLHERRHTEARRGVERLGALLQLGAHRVAALCVQIAQAGQRGGDAAGEAGGIVAALCLLVGRGVREGT